MQNQKKLDWFVYCVECSDGTYYLGISNNVQKRIETHNLGKGARYTKKRRPVRLLVVSRCLNRSEAARHEYRIKRLDRSLKIQAVGDI